MQEKSTDKSGRTHFAAIELPDTPVPQTKVQDKTNSRDYIPFGSDNLLPSSFAEKYRKSSTHRAIINSKVTYCIGNGLETDTPSLADYLSFINVDRESGNAVLRKTFKDRHAIGNGAWEIVKAGNEVFIYHIDITKIRIKKGGGRVLMHPDWSKYNSNKDLAVEIPVYPEFQEVNGALRSVHMISSYEPEFVNYNMPEWLPCYMDGSLDIDYLISKYNLNRFRNGFTPSAIIDIVGDMSPDEGKELIGAIQDKFTNEDKNSKLFVRVGEAGSSAKIQLLNDISEGTFLELLNSITTKITRAHRFFPSLAGIQTPGQLGDTKQIMTEFEIVMNTIISEEQNIVLEDFKWIIQNETGIDTSDLRIKTSAPVSFKGLIDPMRVLRINELREELGREETENGNELLKDGKRTNNSQGDN